MGELSNVKRALAQRKQGAASAQRYDDMLEEVRAVGMTVRLEKVMEQIISTVGMLERKMDSLARAVNDYGSKVEGSVKSIKIPDHAADISTLSDHLTGLKGEISEAVVLLADEIKAAQNAAKSIKMPTLDLSGVESQVLASTRATLDQSYLLEQKLTELMNRPAEREESDHEEPAEKRTWVFDIERGPGGGMRRIIAKEG